MIGVGSEDNVTFMELSTRLGAYAPVNAVLDEAYRAENGHGDDAPHGYPWHTSFHASSMPAYGHECARKLVLGLMGLPSTETIEPEGRSIMDAGKDGERQIVKRLGLSGTLLSADHDEEFQTGFELGDNWLTGSPDAVMLLPGWNRPHVVETKGKDNEKEGFNKLARGEVEPEPLYVAQLQTYINMAHILGPKLWPDLEPCETGSLVYFNRARPARRLEFFYERDSEWFQHVLELLAEAQRAFIEGRLPDHVRDGKGWTMNPCKWCPMKKDYCKPAWREGITTLEQLADIVQQAHRDYDYVGKRIAVMTRWS